MPEARKKGQFTFRAAAVLFILSAIGEILFIVSEIPLFGEIRGGVVAGIYHVIYFALFAALGAGLWKGEKWAYSLVFVTTALETLDLLQFLFFPNTMKAYEESVLNQLSMIESELQAAGVDTALALQAILQTVQITCVVVMLCWWGFALYTYLRRDYFKSA